MKLATTTGDFSAYTVSQKESIDHIREAGFKYADYNFGTDYTRRTGIYGADWKEYLRDLKAHADNIGITFVQAHSPMGKPLAGDEAFMHDTLRTIESCHILGIHNLVVHSGYLMHISKEECFEKNRAFFMVLLKEAEKYGVNILVENFNKMHVDGMYWIDNAPDLRALIDYVDHPLFHAVWDAGHANMQDMPEDEGLRILGSHVYALHVQDNMGEKDVHLAPMFGTMNMDSLMHGLIDIGYKGYFTFEAGSVFLGGAHKRPFEKDSRLLKPSLALRKKAESLLYDIGKWALESYGMFEE